jgi:hypothetical protein
MWLLQCPVSDIAVSMISSPMAHSVGRVASGRRICCTLDGTRSSARFNGLTVIAV